MIKKKSYRIFICIFIYMPWNFISLLFFDKNERKTRIIYRNLAGNFVPI